MLYFPHIPKCGGTTIKQLFFSAVGRHNCLKIWNKNFGADFDPKEFADIKKATIESKKAIVGHLSFRQALANDYINSLYEKGELHTVTVVRDPIDRRISLLNYMNNNVKHPYHSQITSIDPKTFIMSQPWNFQTEFLKTDANDSMESILNRISVFPIEASETLVRHWLEGHTNQVLNPVRKANVAAESYPDSTLFRRDSLTADLISVLETKHNIDFRLYEESKKAFSN